ncbi:E3 ubiquitin-protein ligase UPL1-like [Iris pallida]|uniref:E3 ubiquitin-protein ligase UPL1-like n=1 Tax=Iris pallida TaxID=29817 RepID=A0AAX6IJA6_IRIPA|nr:E3 ubiquitin-protein ligase UPL1-like [Iris pallida]
MIFMGKLVVQHKFFKLFPYFSLFKSFLHCIVRKMHRFFMGSKWYNINSPNYFHTFLCLRVFCVP